MSEQQEWPPHWCPHRMSFGEESHCLYRPGGRCPSECPAHMPPEKWAEFDARDGTWPMVGCRRPVQTDRGPDCGATPDCPPECPHHITAQEWQEIEEADRKAQELLDSLPPELRRDGEFTAGDIPF